MQSHTNSWNQSRFTVYTRTKRSVIIAVVIAIKPEKCFRGINGIRTRGLCVSAAVLCEEQLRWSHLHFIRMSAVHIIFICFIPFTGTTNSTNWPAPNVWVFIAQLVKHCSTNAEAMDSNPVEAPKTFFGLTLRLLKSQSQLRWSLLHLIRMSAVHIIFICFIPFTGTMNSINCPHFLIFSAVLNLTILPKSHVFSSSLFCIFFA